MKRFAILFLLASSIFCSVKGQISICGGVQCKPGEGCSKDNKCVSAICSGCAYCGRTATGLRYCNKGQKCISEEQNLCQADDPFCFPGNAFVTLEGGGTKAMEHLLVGDRVQVVLPDGSLGFERVFAFSHRGCNDQMQTIVLGTSAGQVVEASTGHYTLLGDAREPALMSDVKEGDTIWVVQGAELIPTKVVNREVRMDSVGAYAPHTASGTIVASNVAMSCYTDYMRPALASKLLVPVRILSEVICDGTAQRLNDLVLRLLNKGIPCTSLPMQEREREPLLTTLESGSQVAY